MATKTTKKSSKKTKAVEPTKLQSLRAKNLEKRKKFTK